MSKHGQKFEKCIEFIKNYFVNKDDYRYSPANFNCGITSFRPDFYSVKDGKFIHIISTRQGYHEKKRTFELFRFCYPSLTLELRTPDGELIEEIPTRKNLKWSVSVNRR